MILSEQPRLRITCLEELAFANRPGSLQEAGLPRCPESEAPWWNEVSEETIEGGDERSGWPRLRNALSKGQEGTK